MHGHTYPPMHKHTTPGFPDIFILSLSTCVVCPCMYVGVGNACVCGLYVYMCGMCAFCQGMCMWYVCVHGCIHVLCIHMWGVWNGTAYMMNTFVCIVCGMWVCMVMCPCMKCGCVFRVHACDVAMFVCSVHTCDSLCARDRYMNTWMCTHMPMCMFIWSAGSFIAPKIHVLIILSTRIWKCHICGHIHIWAVCGPIHCVWSQQLLFKRKDKAINLSAKFTMVTPSGKCFWRIRGTRRKKFQRISKLGFFYSDMDVRI